MSVLGKSFAAVVGAAAAQPPAAVPSLASPAAAALVSASHLSSALAAAFAALWLAFTDVAVCRGGSVES